MHRDFLRIAAGAFALAIVACSETSPPTAPLRHPGPSARASADNDDVTLDVPLAGLTAAQLDRFNRGRIVFSRVFDAQSGLGPSFNSAACANCHEEPSVGGFGDDLDEDVETHVSLVTPTGCSDLSAFGGAVIQHHTTDLFQQYYPGYVSEPMPAEALGHVAHRTTPALFGFGLLEAIPAATISALADRNAASGGPVKGRANVVNGQLLRLVSQLASNQLAQLRSGGDVSLAGQRNHRPRFPGRHRRTERAHSALLAGLHISTIRSANQTVSVTNLGTTASRGRARRAQETIWMQTTGTALLVVSRRCACLAGVAYLLSWSRWPDLNRRPLRPERRTRDSLAAPEGP